MIYLSIPDYPDPQAPGQSFTACAKIGRLDADFDRGQGQITLDVYRNVAAMEAGAEPVEALVVLTDGRLRGGRAGAAFPSLGMIQEDNAEQWGALWAYFLGKFTTLDGLRSATIVTS